ncbi:MAG: hypothetical protein QW041_01125 [Candidatus Pacearchaeota archaeon]
MTTNLIKRTFKEAYKPFILITGLTFLTNFANAKEINKSSDTIVSKSNEDDFNPYVSPTGKYTIDFYFDFEGFSSQSNDSKGNFLGLNPKAEFFGRMNLPKGHNLYASANIAIQNNGGSITHEKTEIAKLDILNKEISAILGYFSRYGIYGGLGYHIKSRDVDVGGWFGDVDHNEQITGSVLNLGYKSKKGELAFDCRYKHEKGNIEDKLNDQINKEDISGSNEIYGKFNFVVDECDLFFELSKESYNNGTINTSIKGGIYKEISKNLNLGFTTGHTTTKKDNYKDNHIHAGLNVKYKTQKIIK